LSKTEKELKYGVKLYKEIKIKSGAEIIKISIMHKSGSSRSLKQYGTLSLSPFGEPCNHRVGLAILPIDILRVIHCYLKHFEYLQFMNCNKSLFYPIKYETVSYDIIGMHLWRKNIKGKFGST
jgi:hypothetical protein